MLTAGTEVFLQIPGGSGTLHRGRVLESKGGVCRATFEDGAPRPDRELEVLVYHELSGRFVRHTARVRAVDGCLELELTGPPVEAERRHDARVSYLHVYDRLVRELV